MNDKRVLLDELKELKETIWFNPKYRSFDEVKDSLPISYEDVLEAEDRLNRFAPYLKVVFPETIDGIIESPISIIENMKKTMEKNYNKKIYGNLILKRDDLLPIAGSIKARGGIYEVLKHAEELAIENRLLKYEDDYSILAEDKFKEFFLKYTIQVGSTGNLGLSIGIISANSVFPDLDNKTAMEKLWAKVFEATRVDQEDPVKAWQNHDKNLKKYRDFLNEKQFSKLLLKGPGTDLEVYLADEHFWMGGSKESQAGDPFVANIPTEEVFTTPHALKVNGTLKATKPLSLNGKLVDNFGFTFKDGKVVDFYAEQGYDVLEKLMENDEGAKYLGEVALVQNDSPISNTEILFNNTLFDENASVHFALGRAYAYAMQNGSDLSEEELKAKGANFSLIHVDFMVGGPELNITAYEKDGTEVKLFRDGNWVF